MEQEQFRYLQLNEEMDTVIGESYLLGEVDHPNMILDNEMLGNRGDRYNSEDGTFTPVVVITYDIDITNIEQGGKTLKPIKPSMFYVDTGVVDLAADCLFKGHINTSLELPLSKTPIVRFADGFPTNDEFYGMLEIKSGKLTGSINIPKSGDWRIQSNRINNALKVFGIEWEVDFEDIHLIV